MGRDGALGGGDELAEIALDLRRDRVREVQADRLVQVFHRPAAHDAVVAQDDDGRKHGEQPQPLPAGTRRELFHGPEGALAAPAADDRLREEDGKDQDETRQRVQDNEGRTAVLPYHIRETPDIAEAHRAAGHGHDYREAAAEVLPGRHSRLERMRTSRPTGATYRIRK